MKEITREDWKKNPTPRMMWVWDVGEGNKQKHFVVHCFTNKDAVNSFVAETGTGCTVEYWKHCAEIDESQFRRKTNYELAKWLADGASCREFREYRYADGSNALHSYSYIIEDENEPCDDNILIRVNGGEWREPLKESE